MSLRYGTYLFVFVLNFTELVARIIFLIEPKLKDFPASGTSETIAETEVW